MRKLLFASLLVLFCFPAIAQQDTKLLKQIEELRAAMVDPNQEMLDRLVADGLSYGHSSGNVETKTQFIQNLMQENSNFSAIDFKDQSIIIHKKTAVVRHNLHGKTMDKGKAPGEVNLHVMTVWIKEGKGWKLLARQAVKKA